MAVPAKFSSNRFDEFIGASTVRFRICNEFGKFAAVPAPIASALNPSFVNRIPAWLLDGSSPSDQKGSSQLPLVGLVQLLYAFEIETSDCRTRPLLPSAIKRSFT